MKRISRAKALVGRRIKKRVAKLRVTGVSGIELRNQCFKIKMQEENRKEPKYTKASVSIKKEIRSKAVQSGNIERFQKIQHRSQLYMLIQTKQYLVDIANRTNMFELIFENLRKFKINQKFPCELIDGNVAWISQGESGMHRYFTKQPGSATIGLSIFDLIEIVDGVEGFKLAQEELARLLDLDDLKDAWVINKGRKYVGNLGDLERSNVIVKKRYPTLYRYIQGHLWVLKFMNQHGLNHVNRQFVHKNEPIFYIATTFIAENMAKAMNKEKTDQPAVSRAINLLVLLGLLKKIPHQELSSDLLDIAQEMRKGEHHRLVTFYQIPSYEDAEVMKSAEAMAKKLEELGIRNSRLVTEKSIMQVFGKEKAEEIYVPQYVMKIEEVGTTEYVGHSDDDDIPDFKA